VTILQPVVVVASKPIFSNLQPVDRKNKRSIKFESISEIRVSEMKRMRSHGSIYGVEAAVSEEIRDHLGLDLCWTELNAEGLVIKSDWTERAGDGERIY